MKSPLASILLLLPLACAVAQPADPLKSPACGAALAELQAARRAGAAAAAIGELRSAASAACLGSTAVPSRPARVARPPVVVPPPQVEVPQGAAPLPAPAAAPPPVALERPAVPATCDAGGCWTNDGTHLRQLPPGLAGPNGLCTRHGGLVYCP